MLFVSPLSGPRALALTLPLLSLASASSSSRSVHSRAAAPDGWTKVARAAADESITLRVTLPAADISALHSSLADVSTPGSAKYGQYLSREEVGALVAPSAETAAAVQSWLGDFDLTGAAKASAGGDVLTISTTVGVAEKLLAPAEYWVFRKDEEKVRRTLEWGVPKEIEDAVETVHPSTVFPASVRPNIWVEPLSNPASAVPETSCADTYTPDCARSLYTLGNDTNSANAKNGAAIFSDGGHSTLSDLKKFLAKFVPSESNGTFTTVNVDGGGENGADYDEEAALDTQILVGLSAPAPVSLLVGNDNGEGKGNEWPSLAAFADTILNMTTPPSVASISYGGLESELEDSATSFKTMTQICNAFAQVGARGTTVLASSGDSGVTKSGGKFNPQFPASCPYITAVGGTYEVPEIADPISGGGFSNVFAQPSYQTTAVEAYLKALGSKDQGLYNASGRAYPDVAAQSRNWTIVYDGEITPGIGGTSASCPTWAAVVQHLNNVQLSAGKATLGFLNPWLYGTASSAIRDITKGHNALTVSYPKTSGIGFNATTGWDPATGFGVPDFAKMVPLLP